MFIRAGKKDAVFLQDKVKSSVPIRLWQRIDRALFQDSRHHDLEKIETGVINPVSYTHLTLPTILRV